MRNAIVLLLLAAGPAAAQTGAPAPAAPPMTPVAEARALWMQASAFLTRAADGTPDSSFAFRPTPAVRSFGQLIAHVAGAQRMFCGLALAEPTGSEDDIEKSATTKAAIVAALRESNSYCARAYTMSEADAAAVIDLFGAPRTKRYALLMNATHDNEHYGNVVTYMRLMGMVPPSSQPAR